MNLKDLDSDEAFRSVDRSGMIKSIISLPYQLEKGWEIGKGKPEISLPFRPRSFVISGMGGSAIGGDIFRDIVEQLADLTVIVNRNYSLPRNVGRDALHIAISYSGNTEETVSSLKDAVRRGIPTLSISSGGEVERISAEKGITHFRIPGGQQPRAAVGFMLSCIIAIADSLSVYEFRPLMMDTIQDVREQIAALSPQVPAERNEAKKLANWLSGFTPLVVTTPGVYSIGERMKTQFNENSKKFAWLMVLPELNHNDWIPLFEDPTVSNYRMVLLTESNLNPMMRRRIGVVTDLIRRRMEFRALSCSGKNLIAGYLRTMAVGDLASYYLSILEGRDPSPVAPIEELKREIASRPL
jgi:glucose/mannose-6-phosphate isomerase